MIKYWFQEENMTMMMFVPSWHYEARWTGEKADLNLRRRKRCDDDAKRAHREEVLDTLFENESIWPESLHGVV